MSHVLIKDGTEDLIASAVDYLEGLGVPRQDVRALSVGGTVNGPMTIIAEIFVHASEPKGGAAETEVIERVDLGHEGSDRWTGGDRKDAP